MRRGPAMLQWCLHRWVCPRRERVFRRGLPREQLRTLSRECTVLPHRRAEPDDLLLPDAGLPDVGNAGPRTAAQEEAMHPNHDAPFFRVFTRTAFRRDTLRPFAALATGILAAAGLNGGDETAAKKRHAHRGKDRHRHRNHDKPAGASRSAAQPRTSRSGSDEDDTAAESAAPISTERKKGKPAQPGQTGPTGPTGPVGPGGQNDIGPTGPQGSTGPTGRDGQEGSPGAAGAAGPTGPTGVAGPVDATIQIAQDTLDAVLNQTRTIEARCPNLNSRLLGGGFDTGVSGATGNDIEVNLAAPFAATASATAGYRIRVTRRGTTSGGLVQVSAYAICST